MFRTNPPASTCNIMSVNRLNWSDCSVLTLFSACSAVLLFFLLSHSPEEHRSVSNSEAAKYADFLLLSVAMVTRNIRAPLKLLGFFLFSFFFIIVQVNVRNLRLIDAKKRNRKLGFPPRGTSTQSSGIDSEFVEASFWNGAGLCFCSGWLAACTVQRFIVKSDLVPEWKRSN